MSEFVDPEYAYASKLLKEAQEEERKLKGKFERMLAELDAAIGALVSEETLFCILSAPRTPDLSGRFGKENRKQ